MTLLLLVAEIRPTKAILAVVDLNARFLDRTIVPIVADPKQGVDLIAKGMQHLQARFRGKTWEGAGISLPGRVNKVTQRLAWAPNLPWVGFDIRGTLQKALKIQVELENAANACLLSEVWFGHMQGIQNAVLITISEGVGAAAAFNPELILLVGDITLRWDAVGPIVNAELAKRQIGGARPRIAILSDGEAARLRRLTF